jgi:hypothetical protein
MHTQRLDLVVASEGKLESQLGRPSGIHSCDFPKLRGMHPATHVAVYIRYQPYP